MPNKPLINCQIWYISIPDTTPCKGSYTHQFGNSCYALLSDKKTWVDAENTCKALGGFLAEILTSEQNSFLTSIIFVNNPTPGVWLGAHDMISEGKWFWATSDNPVDEFTYWSPGQPSNVWSKFNERGGEDCMEFHYTWRHWNDAHCDDVKPFVCQKNLDSIVVG